MATNAGKKHTKKANANPWHRSRNTVRTKPRKAFGSGPVVKGQAFGRCRSRSPEKGRYT